MRLRPYVPTTLLLLLVLGCSRTPEPSTDYTPAQPLEGIPSAWSVRLDSLGDVDLLGDDSAMKEALLATGDSVYVAATSFEVDGIYAVDMIIVNHSEHELTLNRQDIHLIDAEGRWLEPLASAPRAAALGLQGRRYAQSDAGRVYEVPDRTEEVDRELMMVETGAESTHRPRKVPRIERDRTHLRNDDTPEATAPELAGRALPVVNAVRIAPGEGRAFWAYFEGSTPPMPLTALVVLEEQQLGFKFSR